MTWHCIDLCGFTIDTYLICAKEMRPKGHVAIHQASAWYTHMVFCRSLMLFTQDFLNRLVIGFLVDWLVTVLSVTAFTHCS